MAETQQIKQIGNYIQFDPKGEMMYIYTRTSSYLAARL